MSAPSNVVNNVNYGYYTSGKMFNHLWILQYETLQTIRNGYYTATEERFDDFDGNTWKLKLTNVNHGTLVVSMYLLSSANQPSVNAMFSLVALKEGRPNLKTFKTSNPIIFKHSPFEVKTFTLTKTELLSDSKPLFILCRIDLDVFESARDITSTSVSTSDDFLTLFESGNHSDVTLDVDSQQEFKVHKAILSARSTVFAAMFEHQMMENTTNRVVITDINPEVVQEMLRFVYSGVSPNIKGMAAALLAAAEKYALMELKRLCIVVLIQNTTLKTAVEYLILADRYDAPQLKIHTMRFINVNAATVTASEGWTKFRLSHAYLICDLYEDLADLKTSVA